VRSRIVVSLVASVVQAISRSVSEECGQAIARDTSNDADAIGACKDCKGQNAILIYDRSMADGLGYTWCTTRDMLSASLKCGEAFAKDTSHDANAFAACKNCKGANAVLIYDAAMADYSGYTYCYAGQVSMALLDARSVPEECGQAIAKDTSNNADALAACKDCKGENAVLIYDLSMADGLGYTWCTTRDVLSASLTCGEAYAKDTSHDPASVAACKQCKGPDATLIYDSGMLDNIGMTYCQGAGMLSSSLTCGEAYAKDTSHDSASVAACKQCKGPDAVLIYDGGMLDNIGMTYCQRADTQGYMV